MTPNAHVLVLLAVLGILVGGVVKMLTEKK